MFCSLLLRLNGASAPKLYATEDTVAARTVPAGAEYWAAVIEVGSNNFVRVT